MSSMRLTIRQWHCGSRVGARCGLAPSVDWASRDPAFRDTMQHSRPARLLPDRRHLRLHGLPRRCRARPCAGHPRGPDRRGRHRAPAELPAGQARRRRRVHLRAGRADRRVDAAGHDRALLLRVPPSPPRCPPGDVVRVQRVQPDPGPRPQVRGPPRRGDHPEGRGPPGAAGIGRDRRPPAAQERGRREARDERLRAAHPGVHRCGRHRSGGAGHARPHRDVRPDRRGTGLGPRPGAPLAGRGGARAGVRHAGASRSSPCRCPTRRRRRSPGSS